jgi:hypothetical protein
MPTNLIRYNGVNDPQQNIVEIDLSAIPTDSLFTIDILYSCRALGNSTEEQAAIYRYILFYLKIGMFNYSLIKAHKIVDFGWNLSLYALTLPPTISLDTLYLDLINSNTDTTVLFDCKLSY